MINLGGVLIKKIISSRSNYSQMKPSVFLLSLFFFLTLFNAHAQFFESLNGPSGINVEEIVPAPDGNIFIVSNKRVFRSTDDGDTWELLTDGIPDDVLLRGLTFSPSGDAFAVGGNEFFQLPSGSDKWIKKTLPNGGFNPTISINPEGNIFIFNGSGELYFAESDPSDLVKIADTSAGVTKLFSYGNDQNYLMSSFGLTGKLLRFSDDGSVFEDLTPVFAGGAYFQDLERFSDTLIVSSDRGLYISTDAGMSWIYKDINGDSEPENVHSSHVRPGGGIYFLTWKGVYYSEDYGATTELLTDPPFDLYTNFLNSGVLAFRGQNEIFYAVREFFFSHSTDNGQTWKRLDTKFKHPSVWNIKKNSDGVLFTNTNKIDGVEFSEDDGETWEELTVNGQKINRIDFHPNGDWFAITGSVEINRSIWRTSDKGQTWSDVTPEISNSQNQYDEIAVVSDGNIFVEDNHEIWVSKDLGETWIKTDLLLNNYNFPPAKHGNGKTYFSNTDGLFFSENGVNWNEIPNNFLIFNIPYISDRDKIYFSGFNLDEPNLGFQLWVSDETGENFTPLPFLPGVISLSLKILSDCDENLILLSGSGIFLSLDLGNSWINLGFGLDERSDFTDIYLDKSYFLYLGMSHNVIHKSKGPTCDFVSSNDLKIADSEIRVFPNPMSDIAFIEIENESNRIYSVQIFDLTGKSVRTEKFNSNQHKIEKENLNSGIYFYQIENENQILKTGKLIIR